jgi:kynurenine formamidase
MGLKWPILSTDPPKLLSYDELPVRPDAPAGSSWSLWADGDVGGALNLLTPERVRKAAACIRTGQLFALDHDLDFPDPPVFSRRTALHHEVVSASGRAYDDVIDKFNTQSSTQWDGFRHYPHPDHGFYGGRRGDTHGVHHWASRGLAGRAVLVDIEHWAAARNRPFQPGEPEPITADDLESCLSDQRIALETGDILLVRTGWLDWYRALPPERRPGRTEAGMPTSAGLEPSASMAAWLWDHHVAAVAADNPALEVYPPGPEGLVLHPHLLGLLGIPIGELFNLDALAADCASTGTYDAFLTSSPLHLRAGAASPPNAIAIR